MQANMGFPGGAVVKNPPVNAGDAGDVGWILGKIPWKKKWQPPAVFLPGKSHGQNLVGYSLWGHKRVGQDLATK